MYESLRASLVETLTKLDRRQQRLQGSFLAAREYASSNHIAETINELRQHQQQIAKNQEMTEELNKIVSRLTILLLGPTIVFGALSVTDTWIRPSDYTVSMVLLVVYALAGLALSWAVRKQGHLLTRLFALSSNPEASTAGADLEAGRGSGTARSDSC